jgi:ATP-dependent helicase HepA
MLDFVVGQRWVSETEPELGLGTVVARVEDRVRLCFTGADEERQYAVERAPLRRVMFGPGDRVTLTDGTTREVTAVKEVKGLRVYTDAGGISFGEEALADHTQGASPEGRLGLGDADPLRSFALRVAALEHRHRRRRSTVRGFVGGRMDLIPHQLYIAREVAGRWRPRVLLADEVGLGKTVEAGLILHRLLVTGRISRALVVVPESLVHQWFIELRRRFNLWFHLFDEARCAAIEAGDPEGNPFHDEQLILCGLPLLLDPRRARMAAAAGWDMVVVDEAHHLGWSPDQVSPEYQAVEGLSRASEGLLLLTATPEQLGVGSHFARLRLLDPERYPDLGRFQAEAKAFGEVAKVAEALLSGRPLRPAEQRRLHAVLRAEPAAIQARLEQHASGDAAARAGLVQDLLDRHGTGRVVFRNTRSAMQGFPRRVPCPVPLEAPGDMTGYLDRLAAEFDADLGTGGAASSGPAIDSRDPRVRWLAALLREHPDDKVLLIGRSRSKIESLDQALRAHLTVPTAVFHEGLDLVQRDRQAAWFADPDGARILLASEIGSEGRNFQFAHRLVLMDLPMDPELIEQRMGRLDRIGQKSDIQIHVPYVRNSPQEVLFRWFHDGLDAFGHPQVAGRELRDRLGAEVRDLAQDFHETHDTRRPELEALIRRTRTLRQKLETELEKGRDRLLEMHSYRPEPAREVVEAVRETDGEPGLEAFLLEVWDHLGVAVEDLGPRTYRVGGEDGGHEALPGLPPGGCAATFDRKLALAREDVAFLTWDHPMVLGALDAVLGGREGTCAVVAWEGSPGRGLWLEVVYVLECVAPPALQIDRFLPATPVRVSLDVIQGRDVTERARAAWRGARLRDVPARGLADTAAVRHALPGWMERGRATAEVRARAVVEEARRAMDTQLGHELERLRALAAVNPLVGPEELEGLAAQRVDLARHLEQARLRVDAVRLVVLEG